MAKKLDLPRTAKDRHHCRFLSAGVPPEPQPRALRDDGTPRNAHLGRGPSDPSWQPAAKQLTDCTRVTQDFVLHREARWTGEIRLGKSARCDLKPLAPLAIASAFHRECSYRRVRRNRL